MTSASNPAGVLHDDHPTLCNPTFHLHSRDFRCRIRRLTHSSP